MTYTTAPTATMTNAADLFHRVFATLETQYLIGARGYEIEIYSDGKSVGVNVWADNAYDVLFAERENDHRKIIRMIRYALHHA